jgi:DMSO/TMAO reductase YedYZ molybdopterin-dependent catalytic subunit
VERKIFLILLFGATLGLLTSATIIQAQSTPEWTVKIDGAVSNPTALTITEIMTMPNRTVYAELYCYGSYVTGGNWTGVSLSFILETVGYDQNAMSVGFSATDGYSRGISITDAMREDVIIAYEIDMNPLPETLRLVAPGANGEFWVGWIDHIFVSPNSPSYAQSAGSSFSPPAWMQQKVPTPEPTPSPEPTSTPIPQPKPTPSPSTSPPVAPIATDFDTELFPITWVMAAIAIVATACIGFLVYSKRLKNKKRVF